MSLSKVRQNFDATSEANINKQINMELYASYVYMSMYTYFARDDVALHGFAKFFRTSSEEEREHAYKLVDYQNMRGGNVVFKEVAKPNKSDWGSAADAVEAALEMERTVNQSLLDLHKNSDDSSDPQLCDFIEGNFLDEQVRSIKELGDLLSRIKRAGDGLGVHVIDKELMS